MDSKLMCRFRIVYSEGFRRSESPLENPLLTLKLALQSGQGLSCHIYRSPLSDSTLNKLAVLTGFFLLNMKKFINLQMPGRPAFCHTHTPTPTKLSWMFTKSRWSTVPKLVYASCAFYSNYII